MKIKSNSICARAESKALSAWGRFSPLGLFSSARKQVALRAYYGSLPPDEDTSNMGQTAPISMLGLAESRM